MRFFNLMEGNNFTNPEFKMAWEMMQGHIMGAQSYLQAGHDVRAVLSRVAEQVKMQMQDLEFRLNGAGGKHDMRGTGPDGRAYRPIDKI